MGANLRGADLWDANLRCANLQNANLEGACLWETNLRYAELQGANLEGAAISPYQIPQEGELIVWKKLSGGHMAKLRVPPQAGRTITLVGRKCRAEFVEVLAIDPLGPAQVDGKYRSGHTSDAIYEVGKTVYPDSYDPDIRVECTNGIHFFLTKEEAEQW
jgi:hypothetical protein